MSNLNDPRVFFAAEHTECGVTQSAGSGLSFCLPAHFRAATTGDHGFLLSSAGHTTAPCQWGEINRVDPIDLHHLIPQVLPLRHPNRIDHWGRAIRVV